MRTILMAFVATTIAATPVLAENSKAGQPTLRRQQSFETPWTQPASRALSSKQGGQVRNFISTFESSDADEIYKSMQYGRPNRGR